MIIKLAFIPCSWVLVTFPLSLFWYHIHRNLEPIKENWWKWHHTTTTWSWIIYYLIYVCLAVLLFSSIKLLFCIMHEFAVHCTNGSWNKIFLKSNVTDCTNLKYQRLIEFHLLARMGCCKMVVFSPFKLEISYYQPFKGNK